MILSAKISSGITGEDGPDFEDEALPLSYEKAMEPYVKKGSKAGPQICKNLSLMLRATLIPQNLNYQDQIFSTSDEVEAYEVKVTGFHFDGDSNLPEITAEAKFKVNLKSSVSHETLQKLEADGETLGDAINFYWKFDDNPLEDWDGSLTNNSGIEAFVLF